MNFESPGEHGRSPTGSSPNSASTLSSLSADRALRRTAQPQSGVSPDRQKRASLGPAASTAHQRPQHHRDPHHRKSFSGEDLTFLSSLSAISLRASSESDPRLERTFFSNADEMLWSKRNEAIRRREEKERLWQIHVENVRRFREPELARRLESARNHRLHNKKVRETLQKSNKLSRPDVAVASTTAAAAADSSGAHGRTETPMSQALVRHYFYAPNGIPILPEGLEFTSLNKAHVGRPVVSLPTAGKSSAALADKRVDENSRRDDAWFTTAKHRMRQEHLPN